MRKSPRCCGLLYWQSSCPPLPTLKAMRQLSAPGKRMAPHQLRSPRPIPSSGCWRDAFLSIDGAVECVDQDLNLDELDAGPLGLVPVERRGQHLRMPVPVRGHTLTGFLQRFKSLAHFGCFQTEDWRRSQRESYPYTDSGHQRHSSMARRHRRHDQPAYKKSPHCCGLFCQYQPRCPPLPKLKVMPGPPP